jgi:penicillin-binding protein 2
MLIFDQLKKGDPHLRVLTIGVLAGMGILLAGLWFVQVISYHQHAENQKSQSFRTVRIPAIRGKILDRNGIALGENQPSYNVTLYLDELREQFQKEYLRIRPRRVVTNSVPFWQRWLGASSVKVEDVKLTLAQKNELSRQARYDVVSNITQRLSVALGQPISLTYSNFLKHYTNQLALPLPILVNLSEGQIARLQEQANNPSGLDLEVQPMRLYPFGTTAAHVLGVLRRDDSSAKDEDAFFNFRMPDYRGDLGVEYGYDEYLRGKAGVKSVLVNSLGYRQSEQIWTPAEPGKNVVLTIDVKIQQEAERALAEALPGQIVRGAAVVMDPNTGDILALVSTPSFDPNLYIPKLTPANWQKMADETLKPQMNRATQQNYSPGSIFKIAIAAACLERGLDPEKTITVQADSFKPGHGCIFVGHRKIEDTAPPGQYNFRRAFIRSSNSYFVTNGIQAGIEEIVALGQRLHLGERCGLRTRQETPGIFPGFRRVKTRWFDGDTANLCIGQGEMSVTPLQMAIMVAAIANGGKVLAPRLVDRIEPQDGSLGEPVTVMEKGRVRGETGLSTRTLQIIREGMLADVEDKDEGTGKAAAVPGLRICAKTGTAQVTDERNRVVDHTTWFASYAPFENPRYVVLVMVEAGGLSGLSGGGTCAPVARRIYEEIQKQERYRTRTPVIAEVGR